MPAADQNRVRAPRVNVPNGETLTITVHGKSIVGALSKLSTTGGSVRLAKCLPRGTLADIALETTSGTIVVAAEFLASVATPHGTVQPFRFVNFDPSTRNQLAGVLEQMRRQGFGERSHSLVQYCTHAARRVIGRAAKPRFGY